MHMENTILLISSSFLTLIIIVVICNIFKSTNISFWLSLYLIILLTLYILSVSRNVLQYQSLQSLQSTNEKFTNQYNIPYVYLGDSISHGNPLSVDNMYLRKESEVYYNPSNSKYPYRKRSYIDKPSRGQVKSQVLSKQNQSRPNEITYQGYQLPLSTEERMTYFETPSLTGLENKTCKPECCYGPQMTSYSCSGGCVCKD